MKSLGEFLIEATKDELTEFRNDLRQLVQLFLPSLEKYRKNIQEYVSSAQGIRWDEKTLCYQVLSFRVSGPSDLRELIEEIQDEYVRKDPGQIEKICQTRPWFIEWSPLWSIGSLITTVLTRVARSEPLDEALDAEMHEIRDIRDPWQERVAKHTIQNLVVEEGTILDFDTHVLNTEEELIKVEYQEDGKPAVVKDVNIPAMSLTLKSRMFRLSPQEYQEIAPRSIATDPYNISTVVEFSYKLPEDFHSYAKASMRIDKAMKDSLASIQRALMLTLHGDFPITPLDPKYMNKYKELFFGEARPLMGPRYHSDFFTGKKILKKDFFPRLLDLQKILLKMDDSCRIDEGLDLLSRAEGIMRIDPIQTIVMYWSFLEKFIRANGYFLMGIAAHLYGCNNTEERRNEFNFWRTMNNTRNGYVHGTAMEVLDQNIKKYYPSHGISFIARASREKAFRIFLFSLLLLRRSTRGPDDPAFLFNWGKERLLGRGWRSDSEDLFDKWIQKGSDDELGNIDKWKRGYKTSIRMV